MKRLILLAGLTLLIINTSWAGSQGPNAPSTNGADGGYWKNQANMRADDGSYATYLGTEQGSSILSNFGFTAVDSVVTGVKVSIKGKKSVAGLGAFRVRLYSLGNYSAWNADTFTTTNETVTFGDSMNLWGLGWAGVSLTNDYIALNISDNDATADTLYFDYVTITYYYLSTNALGTASTKMPTSGGCYSELASSNDVYCEVSDAGTYATGYGFSIPAGATIHAVVLPVEWYSDDYNPTFSLTKDGSTSYGPQERDGIGLGEIVRIISFDFSTLSISDINSSTFGVQLISLDGCCYYVDYAPLTIYYTAAATPSGPNNYIQGPGKPGVIQGPSGGSKIQSK